jgi:hypothetical protein
MTLLEKKLIDGLSRLRKLYKPTRSIRCQICGKRFKTVSYSHLKEKHQMTVADYKEIYNLLTVTCDLTRHRQRKTRVLYRAEIIWLKKYWNQNKISQRDAVRMLGISKGQFRTWRQMLELPPAPYYHRWRPDLILEAIHQRQRQGKSLMYSKVYAEHNALLSAGIYHFGSWQNALKQSGIPRNSGDAIK